jgi:hypothetical protein
VANGDFGGTLDVSTFLSSFLAFFTAFFSFFASFSKAGIHVSGLHGQRRIHGERLYGHAHCSKKAGTKKESSAVHLYLQLVDVRRPITSGRKVAGPSGQGVSGRRDFAAPVRGVSRAQRRSSFNYIKAFAVSSCRKSCP